MALSRTTKIQASSAESFGTGSYNPGSFTPANNSLLLVIARATAESDTGFDGSDLTITPSTGTATSRINSTTSPGWSYGARIWTIPITTGSSMSVSIGSGGENIHQYRVEVYQYTGHDSTTPVSGAIAGSNLGGDGGASITLTTAPAAGDETIGVAEVTLTASGVPGCTNGSGFTEVWDTFTDAWSLSETESRTGSTSTTVDWTDLNTAGGTGGGAIMLGLTVKVSASGASITGTGAITSSKATASGSALRASTAMGSVQSSKATASGAGTVGHTGTGAITAPHPAQVLSSIGGNKTGSGAITSSVATAAGTASRGHTDVPGAIDITMGTPATISGIATIGVNITGTGALLAPRPDLVSGVASKVRNATGALTAPHPTLVSGIASKARALTGTGALAGPSGYIINGISSFGHSGTGAIQSSKAFVNGTGAGVIIGSDGPMRTHKPATNRGAQDGNRRPAWQR